MRYFQLIIILSSDQLVILNSYFFIPDSLVDWPMLWYQKDQQWFDSFQYLVSLDCWSTTMLPKRRRENYHHKDKCTGVKIKKFKFSNDQMLYGPKTAFATKKQKKGMISTIPGEPFDGKGILCLRAETFIDDFCNENKYTIGTTGINVDPAGTKRQNNVHLTSVTD